MLRRGLVFSFLLHAFALILVFTIPPEPLPELPEGLVIGYVVQAETGVAVAGGQRRRAERVQPERTLPSEPTALPDPGLPPENPVTEPLPDTISPLATLEPELSEAILPAPVPEPDAVVVDPLEPPPDDLPDLLEPASPVVPEAPQVVERPTAVPVVEPAAASAPPAEAVSPPERSALVAAAIAPQQDLPEARVSRLEPARPRPIEVPDIPPEPPPEAPPEPEVRELPPEKPDREVTLPGSDDSVVVAEDVPAQVKDSVAAQPGGPDGSALAAGGEQSAQDLVSAIQQQVAPCWRAPPSDGATVRSVVVLVSLNPNGTVRKTLFKDRARMRNDPTFRALAKAAEAAFLRCGPYRLPAEQYGLWRELEMDFYTR